ncbi:hypothetical protein DLAC_10666 [Tieghemostelium lacteum]|uniref:Paramecium surface antigen repeat-containing protein n=1 Tax=Tieghemostelium lacteum TaxID=361077 RepID=A0A151Z4G8_TIELA|nr:hypothetical protein DLAC_10666 [Tieghemostelium lacteum]|eukprot:KYQ88862.1 hypothetical protein DLAC_10666 [Tieghemostelium lacteum]
MYKLTILLILVLFASIYSSQQCDELTCAGEGQECTTDYYSVSGLYLNDLNSNGDFKIKACGSGMVCSNQVCIKVVGEGEPCSNQICNGTTPCLFYGNGCQQGLVCYQKEAGTPATCQYLQYLTIGQECESTLQCLYTLECNQDSGVCEFNPKPRVLADDVQCYSTLQCAGGQYCNADGQCVDAGGAGAACTDSAQCQLNTGCLEGVCTDILSLGVGQVCENDYNIPLCNIANGLYCSDTGKCEQLPPVVQGNCSDSVNHACDVGQQCICSNAQTNEGQCTPITATNVGECVTAYKAFFNCMLENKSPSPYAMINMAAKPSPAMINCGEFYCSAVSSCQVQSVSNQCNTDVFAGTICETSSASSIQIISFISLIILLLSL